MIDSLRKIKRKYFDKGYHFKLFFKDNKNDAKILDYELNSESIFFELGGYKGDYSEKIISKFDCNLYIFEPDSKYYNILAERFMGNDKVKILNYAVSNKNKDLNLNRNGESSTIGHNKEGKGTKVKGTLLSDFIKNNNIDKIDLVNMNIEGSEYVVLRDLIINKQIKKINSLQVQFHRNKKFYKVQRKIIHYFLRKSHKLVWSYSFVWERWDKF